MLTAIMLTVISLNVIVLIVICHHADYRSAKCRYADFHYTKS
jgi:hypothetical protein